MTISLIIPAYNEEKYLPGCLESLQRYGQGKFLETIVVDNASTDGTAQAATRFPGVRVVREERKGLTHARQRGLQEARGDLLAYIDADSRISPMWAERIERAFGNDPGVVCLSGPYRYYDLGVFSRFWVMLYWYCLAVPTYLFTRTMVVGGNFVARKDALEKIGGFDTSISFYGEDTNIARRLRGVGRVRFSPLFYVYSSARRLKSEGVVRSAWVYGLNFASELLFHKQATREYNDIR